MKKPIIQAINKVTEHLNLRIVEIIYDDQSKLAYIERRVRIFFFITWWERLPIYFNDADEAARYLNDPSFEDNLREHLAQWYKENL